MITKHTIYVITCDKCGRTFSQHEDDGYMTWFYNKKELLDDAKMENWVKDGKHFYCPDCLKEAEND